MNVSLSDPAQHQSGAAGQIDAEFGAGGIFDGPVAVGELHIAETVELSAIAAEHRFIFTGERFKGVPGTGTFMVEIEKEPVPAPFKNQYLRLSVDAGTLRCGGVKTFSAHQFHNGAVEFQQAIEAQSRIFPQTPLPPGVLA